MRRPQVVGDVQPQPQGRVGQGRLAQFGNGVEIPRLLQPLGRQVPEGLERLVVQPQPPVRPEHRHRVVQLVQRRRLHLKLGVEPAPQAQLARDVRKQQQNPAQRMRLAHDPQRPAVWQRPAVVGGRLSRLVELQLADLPARIVDDLGQHPTLAQPVQQFGMGRPLVQPGRVEIEQGLERRVVEGQPTRRTEDGDGVREVVQGLVMGLDVTAQGVARLLGLGHVDGEDQDRPAGPGQGLGHDLPRPAPPVPGGPAEAFLMRPDTRGLGRQLVGAPVETGLALARGLHRGTFDLGQPGPIGPDQTPVVIHHPGRRRRGVGDQSGAEAVVPIRMCHAPRHGRQSQPGRAVDRGPLDLPACGVARLERRALGEQSVDPLGVARMQGLRQCRPGRSLNVAGEGQPEGFDRLVPPQ